MVLFTVAFAFIMLFSAFASSFIRPEFSIAIALCMLFGCVSSLVLGKKYLKLASIFLSCAIGLGIVAVNILLSVYPVLGLDGAHATITGVVTEISAAGGNTVYKVKTDSVSLKSAPQNITVLVSGWNNNFAESYDIVSCPVTFYVYDDLEMSEVLNNYSNKIDIYAYTDSPMEIIGKDRSSIGYFVNLIREKISSVIYKFFTGDHAPFMEQVLIGVRGELDYDIVNSFRKSGMSHILAISGMHLVILVGVLEKFFCLFKSHKIKTPVKTVFFVIFISAYMLVGGFGMSLLRSGFMLIAHYISMLFFSGAKPSENLGTAVVAVLIIDPFAACDVGFLMSVFACGAISFFTEPLKGFILSKLRFRLPSFAEYFLETFCVSSVAFLSVLPVSSLVFGKISLISPISNLFACFFAEYSLIFGFIAILTGFIPFLGFAAHTFAFLASLCNLALFKIAEFFAGFSFSYIDASDTWFYIWMFSSVLIIFVPMILRKSFRFLKISLLMSVLLLLSGVLVDTIAFSGTSSIHITALEHGTAISCSSDSGSVLVTRKIDSGDRYLLNFPTDGYDAVISLEPESVSAEHDMLISSEPKLALLSTDDAVNRFDFADEISSGTLTLSEDSYVRIFENGALAFETNGIKILYIFAECDIMDIEPKFRRSDILIIDGVSPDKFPTLRCDRLILRHYGGYYSGTNEIIVLKSGDLSFFAYEGNLTKGSAAK